VNGVHAEKDIIPSPDAKHLPWPVIESLHYMLDFFPRSSRHIEAMIPTKPTKTVAIAAPIVHSLLGLGRFEWSMSAGGNGLFTCAQFSIMLVQESAQPPFS